ncbi:hypothetical protein [Lacticaseibacillus sharpeae]|uniref:Uncharacterized protein n=1 Tax=Lacticaseibacillus sharpeae JCM 1186 = DSM 20505 TaxID=1291052 RepID=A0A0R1ZU41_9LACO|nr:hypothetical protein [Lacticaseibacillus sharpeae]KRM55595.1 hypothetical protein FC18_GL001213 [Lacticaseibacillus sharpeae JCM 1186 = DSM 20505]
MWYLLSFMALVFSFMLIICIVNYRRQRTGFWRLLLIISAVAFALFLLLFVLPPIILLFQ